MKKTVLGITGAAGFIGRHLCGRARANADFEVVEIYRADFADAARLAGLVGSCDAVVHLAGVSRHPDGDELMRVNLELTDALAAAVESSPRRVHVYLAGTTHARDLPYHRSKREAARRLAAAAERRGVDFTELKISNTFGPYSRPFYNSVVSTFCALAATGETPEQIAPVTLELIGIGELCRRLLAVVKRGGGPVEIFPACFHVALPELWRILQRFADGSEPLVFADGFERELFETFRSYLP